MSKAKSDFQLSDYSIEDLNKLVEMANKEIKRKDKVRVQNVRKQMEDLASSVGKSVEEILNEDKKGKSGAKGVPKYRNPDNPEQTWTGRGKRPGWLRDAIENEGRDLSEFAI